MLKDILIKSAELLNRDDIVNELSLKNNFTQNTMLENDILRLIHYYNYTIECLCEKYFSLEFTDEVTSDKNRKIYYEYLSLEPIKIISVSLNNKNCYFFESSNYITVPNSNCTYNVKYSYVPKPILEISSKEHKINGVSNNLICYGIVSEFFASKNMFEESNYWHNKFMFEIFKSKTKLNKKMKATFTI